MVKVPTRPASSREKVTTQEGLKCAFKDAIWQQIEVEELHMC